MGMNAKGREATSSAAKQEVSRKSSWSVGVEAAAARTQAVVAFGTREPSLPQSSGGLAELIETKRGVSALGLHRTRDRSRARCLHLVPLMKRKKRNRRAAATLKLAASLVRRTVAQGRQVRCRSFFSSRRLSVTRGSA
jgi:hypothetical protein